jgi:hypothetical protein
MRITHSTFGEAFFYIGAGLDIEPLLRFTHICSEFIYVNLYLDLKRVAKWYDWALDLCPDIEVLEKNAIHGFDEERHFELNPGYRNHLMRPDFISTSGLHDYLRTFGPARELPQWAIVYRLRRKSTGREITFRYLTAEGLASYMVLSDNGRYAPRVLCTIETGALEHPDGMMNAFFSRRGRKLPLLWVRGYEPRYSPFAFRNNALDSEGVFSVPGMDLIHLWYGGWSYRPRQRSTSRHCKGFITPVTRDAIALAALKPEFWDENHRIICGDLPVQPDAYGKDDVVVLSKRLAEKWQLGRAKVITWDSLTRLYAWWQYDTAEVQLEKLRARLEEEKVPEDSVINLVPNCLEDEGETWFNALRKFSHRTVTWVNRPMDMIDLKVISFQGVERQSIQA